MEAQNSRAKEKKKQKTKTVEQHVLLMYDIVQVTDVNHSYSDSQFLKVILHL